MHCCADSYYAVIGSSVTAVEAAGRSPPPFAELVLLTHAEPLLRPLYLLAGMWEPHFSTCTQIRHSSDVPNQSSHRRDGRRPSCSSDGHRSPAGTLRPGLHQQ
ncbi:DUF6193 family natural product biosynthesis protein [Streptomyces sp. KHY 26]|uniref:DUF6193 family natural product biosynthesis protein n=1 Tax=Streptomyces sp. KHY 26 TaxID=3097359 RepID=UPI00376F465C